MRNARTTFALAGIAALIAVGISCSGSAPVAGWGSETTNGVTAAILRSDGSPAAGATVRLRRADFVAQPPTLAKTVIRGADAVTDDSGRFEILGIDTGDYRIEVSDSPVDSGRGGAVLFSCPIGVGDTVDLGVGTLQPYATIAGTLDTAGRAGQSSYVQVVGLERLAEVDASGRFVVNNLPSGTFSVRVVTPANALILAASGVSVESGDRADITIPSGWRFSKRLHLNTTSTGADVSDDVAGFPLLVRLGPADFDFTQARDSGQDVRFSSDANSALPFEISQWDPAGSGTAIWVKIDTILGNSDRQFITMRWGNPAAQSASDPAAVFDSAGGSAGVWHLDALNDATGNGNDAVNVNAQPTTGVTGGAYSFDGMSSYLQVPPSSSLDLMGKNLTIVLWQRTNEHFNGERIFFEHDVWPNSGEYSFSAYDDSVLSFDFPNANAQVRGKGGNNCSGQWTHLAMTFNDQTDTGRIYRDGVEVKADTVHGSIGSSTAASYIGCRGGVERFFQGDIDEVWVLSRAMPAAWLKLIYENQRVDQAMVRYR